MDWFSDPLGKVFLYSLACGLVGSLIGFLIAYFGNAERQNRYEVAAGVGFIVGASMGALFGIFGIMADRL